MTIQVDKGIPMPVRYGHRYPFRAMAVGDSFFIRGPSRREEGAVRVAACAEKRMGRGGYAVRGVEGGIRVWRVK